MVNRLNEEAQLINFQVERICATRMLNQDDRARWRLSGRAYRNYILDTIVIELIREIGAWRGEAYRIVRWPADWWQAIKDRFFPAWAKRKWPIVYEVRRFEAARLLPNLPLPADLSRGSFPVIYLEERTEAAPDLSLAGCKETTDGQSKEESA